MDILKKRSDEMTIALARLLNKQPFFAVLLFDLLRIVEVVDDSIPTAATDGRYVYVNYPWFKSLKPNQRMFLLAHEVMHPVLNHLARGANYQRAGVGPDLKTWDHKKANIAMDIVINEWLLHIGCGELPPGGMTANHPSILPFGTFTKDDIWDEIYPKLNFPPDDQNGGGGDNGFDQHDFDGPKDGEAGPTESEVKSAVAAAAQSAKMQGNLHASLERFAGELLEPQVDWRAQLRTEVTARAGRDDYTWARPNRKRLALAPHTYMPGRNSEQAGIIAAYVDTSGSIADAELKAFMSEIAGIYSDTNPEEMWIGDCSTRASEPEEVQDCSQIEGYRAKNSGGTHMPAIFRKLKDCGIHPDVCVVLTDGYTDFDQDPGFPVIWVMTTDVLAPYGKNIRIKIGGR